MGQRQLYHAILSTFPTTASVSSMFYSTVQRRQRGREWRARKLGAGADDAVSPDEWIPLPPTSLPMSPPPIACAQNLHTFATTLTLATSRLGPIHLPTDCAMHLRAAVFMAIGVAMVTGHPTTTAQSPATEYANHSLSLHPSLIASICVVAFFLVAGCAILCYYKEDPHRDSRDDVFEATGMQ